MPTPDLWEQLGLEAGVVAAAGAGGKKTILYALAERFYGCAGLTTTVNCPLPPGSWKGEVIIGPEAGLIEQVSRVSRQARRVFFAQPGKREGLVAGVSPLFVGKIKHKAHLDLVLVKADGARRKLIKAPAEGEPNYPAGTNLVLYLVSAHAFGRTLESGIAHRVEKLATVAGLAMNEPIAPKHVARLLSSELGAMQGLEFGTRLVPVINRADTTLRRRQATEAVRMAMTATDRFDMALVGCMGENPPSFEVVTRS